MKWSIVTALLAIKSLIIHEVGSKITLSDSGSLRTCGAADFLSKNGYTITFGKKAKR